ncbi:MAG: alpha/beta hydrolase [Alistipes sp.]|nr:alpha/beta hydrolase [Alistipes sp.]
MKKVIFSFISLLVGIASLFAQERPEIVKETFAYAEKDGERLFLDRYFVSSAEEQPCIIFMFGGAFARGTRDREDYIPYIEHLATKGYTVVSIDYRLGLKNIAEVDDLSDEVAAGMLVNSIRMAVDDLLDATAFVLDRVWDWKLDRTKFILNGSSAGAVTVLQTEYELCNGLLSGRLPEGFAYAGVMAFAGAVLTLDDSFGYTRQPAPTLLMQGDADRQVPYDVLRLGDIGFYGSKWISGTLADDGVSHAFYSFVDYGHEIASVPIREYWEEIDSFLLHFIERKEPLTILQSLKNNSMPEIGNKDFSISDFLNGNYGL